MMKKVLVTLLAAFGLMAGVHASSGGIVWDKAPDRSKDLEGLQRGAHLFVHYCLNCHSAAYVRYNRLKDIGLTEQQIKDNLLFTTEKVGETMKAAIDPRQAKDWFGGNPPDLTLVARSRSAQGQGTGADYLYTYLRTYFPDDTKATGWDNLAFPNVGMPHVLWELQGKREPQFKTTTNNGHQTQELVGWKQITPGTMSPAQYDQAVGDLVGYLQWMAEPARGTREQIGLGVMAFLLLMAFLTWRLNAAYWKDVK